MTSVPLGDPQSNPQPDPRRKGRVINDAPMLVIRRWLTAAACDFRAHLGLSLAYGMGLFLLGWIGISSLWMLNLSWMILPSLAGGLLVGPIATVGLYRISRRRQSGPNTGIAAGIAAPGQILLSGIILMVFALMWLRSATLVFAVFFGLLPFAGFTETMGTLLATPQGIATLIVGSIVGGLFAALGFAVSAFSIPMLIHREVDCFSAMALSFNATTHNFRLMLHWALLVSVATLLGLITGLIGLIVIFPLLGYATWHAYFDIFEG